MCCDWVQITLIAAITVWKVAAPGYCFLIRRPPAQTFKQQRHTLHWLTRYSDGDTARILTRDRNQPPLEVSQSQRRPLLGTRVLRLLGGSFSSSNIHIKLPLVKHIWCAWLLVPQGCNTRIQGIKYYLGDAKENLFRFPTDWYIWLWLRGVIFAMFNVGIKQELCPSWQYLWSRELCFDKEPPPGTSHPQPCSITLLRTGQYKNFLQLFFYFIHSNNLPHMMNDEDKKYDKTKSTFTSILPRPELTLWLLHLKVGLSWLNIARY